MEDVSNNQLWNLSWITVCGNLDLTTPFCVIEDICEAHGIASPRKQKIDDKILVDYINKNQPKPIKTSEPDAMRWVARFINSASTWKKETLLEAYRYAMSFNDKSFVELVSRNPHYGKQTHISSRSINAILAYSICKWMKYITNRDTTQDQLFNMVRSIRTSAEDVLSLINERLNSNTPMHILTRICSILGAGIGGKVHTSSKTISPTHSEEKMRRLEVAKNDLDNIGSVRNMVSRAVTDEYAILLAAMNYSIDISSFSEPIAEYAHLVSVGPTAYRPLDTLRKISYNCNPYNYNIHFRYNPSLPNSIYTPHLSHLLIIEGIPQAVVESFTVEEAIERVQTSYLSETFYLRPVPSLKTRETPIQLIDIDTIDPGYIICFGVLDVSTSPFHIQELIDLFDNNKNFVNPLTKGASFEINSIKRLLRICSQRHDSPNREQIEFRERLSGIINELLKDLDISNPALRSIAKSKESKVIAISVLRKLLEASMYMRSWKGTGSYPIKSPECLVPPGEEITIQHRASDAILALENEAAKVGPVGHIILDLPLVRYKNKGSDIVICKDKNDGLTIGGRLKIVKDGTELESCIRMSSNWFAYTSHYYLCQLGEKPPFDVFDLAEIS